MTLRRTVHLLVPEGFDDPARPSGGNYYDRRIRDGLIQLGWRVHTRVVPSCWPLPDAHAGRSVSDVMADVPDDSVVLVDGIIASALPAVFVPVVKRLRLVVLIHLPLTEFALDLPDANQREGEVLSAAHAVLTTSSWTRKKLLSAHDLAADGIHVVHPGTDAGGLAAGHADGRRLLCVAAVVENKGHDTLFRALERIAELSWHCTCAGPLDREPAFVDRLRRWLSESRIAGRITFTGTLEGADLSRQYGAADLVVLASRGESFGMVLCEALARGIPVVATRVGGISEAVGTADDGTPPGLLVAPDDVGELAGALARWLEDSQLRDQLRAAARSRRKSLTTWLQSSERVAEVLTKVGG